MPARGVTLFTSPPTSTLPRSQWGSDAQEEAMSKKWIAELQDKVVSCWAWHSPALQITFRYAKPDEDDDFWEIWAFPAVQEIVGGKEDCETVWSGFNFDILEFLTDFEPEAVTISTR